jgi:hypothetical protein
MGSPAPREIRREVNASSPDDIIDYRVKTKPFLKRKKVPKLYFHFAQQKKCPPFSFNIYLAM